MKTKILFLIAVISIISLSSCGNKKNPDSEQRTIVNREILNSPTVTNEYVVFNEKETDQIVLLLKKIEQRKHTPIHLSSRMRLNRNIHLNLDGGKRRDIYSNFYYDFNRSWSNYLPDFITVFYVADEKEADGCCSTHEYGLEYKYNLINPNTIQRSMRLIFWGHLYSYKEKHREEIIEKDEKKIKSDFISLLKFINHQ